LSRKYTIGKNSCICGCICFQLHNICAYSFQCHVVTVSIGVSIGVSGTETDVSWVNGSTNEDGFKLERSSDNINWTEIATLSSGASSYIDTTELAPNKYYYRVRAFKGSEYSEYSNTYNTIPAGIKISSLATAVALSDPSNELYFNNAGQDLPFSVLAIAKVNDLTVPNTLISKGTAAGLSFYCQINSGVNKNFDMAIYGNDAGATGSVGTYSSNHVATDLRSNMVGLANNSWLLIGNGASAGNTTTQAIYARPGGYSLTGQIAKFKNNGIRVGVGDNTDPSAYMHFSAGTATAGTAPLKLTSGTLNSTPEAGAVEFDGANYWVTTTGAGRILLVRTISGTAAPAITPAAIGVQFVDTVNKKLYVATGTSSSADWTILN